MDRFYREFGNRLKTCRKSAKLSQEKLAERVDLNRTSITNIERGRQHIALHSLYSLADAVGVNPRDLLPDGLNHFAPDPATERLIEKVGLSDDVKEWLLEVLSADKTMQKDKDFPEKGTQL